MMIIISQSPLEKKCYGSTVLRTALPKNCTVCTPCWGSSKTRPPRYRVRLQLTQQWDTQDAPGEAQYTDWRPPCSRILQTSTGSVPPHDRAFVKPTPSWQINSTTTATATAVSSIHGIPGTAAAATAAHPRHRHKLHCLGGASSWRQQAATSCDVATSSTWESFGPTRPCHQSTQ